MAQEIITLKDLQKFRLQLLEGLGAASALLIFICRSEASDGIVVGYKKNPTRVGYNSTHIISYVNTSDCRTYKLEIAFVVAQKNKSVVSLLKSCSGTSSFQITASN
jgi:hypothetical protein